MLSETKTVNVHEAKTHLSELLRRVEMGEEFVIARAGKPVARLVRAAPAERTLILGALKGKIWMEPGWEEPLTDEELQDWFGDAFVDADKDGQ